MNQPKKIKIADMVSMRSWPMDKVIEFLQDLGLIAKSYVCPKCNKNMQIGFKNDVSDKYTWICTKCKIRRSLRKGTWFEMSKLSLLDILFITYFWVYKVDQNYVLHEMEISCTTLVDWYNFCREVCVEIVLQQQGKIGGPGIVVDIDEFKFGKLKYNRSKCVKDKWVVGGIERGSNRCFLEVVDNCTIDTLLSSIKEHIEPGTTIISDCWQAYDMLSNEKFNNLAMNQSITFKDPDNGTHTNVTERMWVCVKRTLPTVQRSPETMASYLSEFIYRKIHNNAQDKYIQFLRDIVKVYTPKTHDYLNE